MFDPTQEILNKLNIIEEKIDRLQESYTSLQESYTLSNKRLEKIEMSTGVMDEHVQWVNEVNNVVKKPLFSALNAVNSIVNPLYGPTVDIEEIPNAPTYPTRLTYVKDKDEE